VIIVCFWNGLGYRERACCIAVPCCFTNNRPTSCASSRSLAPRVGHGDLYPLANEVVPVLSSVRDCQSRFELFRRIASLVLVQVKIPCASRGAEPSILLGVTCLICDVSCEGPPWTSFLSAVSMHRGIALWKTNVFCV